MQPPPQDEDEEMLVPYGPHPEGFEGPQPMEGEGFRCAIFLGYFDWKFNLLRVICCFMLKCYLFYYVLMFLHLWLAS